ncbi:uncharacterized protein LOC101450143 [Ceratitis capitata]|uniref:uncharacterized protein LOC101450143 n=1 Tax=Ceratitis capitata TaxID=7213 RepID=UPI000A114503|nr:uncharacterized protein LOC101450143 [Ceratitis capitata]
MFFRRMFARKDSSGSGGNTAYDYDDGDAHGNDGESDGFGAFGGATTTRSKRHSNSNGMHMNGSGSATATGSNGATTSSSSDYELQRRRNERRKYGASTAPTNSATAASKHYGSASTLHRAATSGPATVQLTPLWEHILRTRTLPDNVYPIKIFGEFLERLRDPEWQVRQHALRVFVDVLVVMRDEADAYMDPLIPPLVENLGHQAPTVRKGALDCLRVYLAETAMPETILLQILDIGLNQKITNEPFGGRLTCGVMLSLPALVQSTLHTGKRHYLLRTAVEMLVQKMGQVTHQEITLKVLSKLRDLVGEEEFREYMSNSAYREFDLLCNVYGVEAKTDYNGNRHGSAHRNQDYGSSVGAHTWRVLAKQPVASCWRSSDEEQMLEEAAKGKIIMETEIKINDDTLTMRILEAKDEDTEADADTDSSPHKSIDTYPNSLEDEVVCGRIPSATHDSLHEIGAVVRLLSDSELDMEEDSNDLVRASHQPENPEYYTVITPSTPSRTPKRVTFGGEVVKMRTPDSDANSSNNRNGNGVGPQMLFTGSMSNQSAIDAGGGNGSTGGGASSDSSEPLQRTITTTTTTTTEITIISTPSTSATSSPVPEDNSKMMALSVEIINDNTKPLPMAEQSTTVPRPRTAQSPRRSQVSTNGNAYINTPTLSNESVPNSSTTVVAHSPPKRRDSVGSAGLSPHTPFKRLSVSPVDNIISPKTPHKPIEVMHNLQRDPSPVRARSAKRVEATSKSTSEADAAMAEVNTLQASKSTQVPHAPRAQTPSPLPPKTWEELDIVDFDTLLDLRSGNWHHRLQGVTKLEEALRSSDILAQVQPCLDSLLRTLLSSERNPDVAEAKTQLLINLITRLPLDNLEDRTTQIMTGLCRQGGAGANRVCKALMHRLPAATIVLKLLSQEFLHAKSSRFREHALQMVMYALMTFPSTCFDTTTCVTHATYAALNRKRRVRQAALDVLAILGQITTVRAVVDVVQDVVGEREDGPSLLSAVRTRLSRKQMPIVGADGQVQYALRVPSPHSAEAADAANGEMGADIEWIVAGVGSVSPGSLKRRASRRSFRCLPPHTASDVDSIAMGTPCGSFRIGDGDGTRRHAFQSPPDVYGNFKDSAASNNDLHTHNFHHILGSNVPLPYGHNAKKTTIADYNNYMSRRLVAKSCSDSSMEGRSSDSNYTSSSGGGGGGGGGSVGSTIDKSAAKCNGSGKPATNDSCTGISGRFTRQTVNSR